VFVRPPGADYPKLLSMTMAESCLSGTIPSWEQLADRRIAMHHGDDPEVESRLVESEARYRAVIENASDMIQSVRPDGTFEFVNRAWHQKLGYEQDEVDRLIIWDIVHPDALEHCQPAFAAAIRGETIDNFQTTFITKDRRALPIEGSVTSRFLGSTVVATHGFFRDITERLRAEELEEQNAKLEREKHARYLEKMAALGKLSAGLSHELNNPAAAAQRAGVGLPESLARRDEATRELTARGLTEEQWRTLECLVTECAGRSQRETPPLEISRQEEAVEDWLETNGVEGAWNLAPILVGAGVTEESLSELATELPVAALPAALRWLAESVEVRNQADVVARSTRRISELVSAVKAYSFMDRTVPVEVDVHDGLENTLVILAHRLKNMSIRRDYDRTIPPVRTLGSSLNQVWTNIIDNAADATNDAGTITIRTRRVDDLVVVEIEDDGCGIRDENVSRVFEPFFTTKPQGQGTGLGLDIVWRIVTEEHGGGIEVESRPGRTVFRVSLPIRSHEEAL
jgi:PAS domain S-box-containing protein